MRNPTHNGVLVPDEMRNAPVAALDAYAEQVKRGNRSFIEACFALEDAAERAGVDLDSPRSTHPADGPEARAGATARVLGCDLVEGDILFFLSTPHRITHFVEYDGPLSVRHGGPMPEGTRIAYSGDPADPHCWGMTIDPHHRFAVA